MRKIFWTIIVLGTLSASLPASGETACDVWIKEFDRRAVAFNSECVDSGRALNSHDYCTRESRALDAQQSRIFRACRR
jgi:hypothetical protein